MVKISLRMMQGQGTELEWIKKVISSTLGSLILLALKSPKLQIRVSIEEEERELRK